MEITAFGPFAGRETIDFDTLNEAGVFLLNGETGSGKTSVLDAICFALYGSGPTTAAKGGRKAQHSDHADPHTGPRVEVEFTAGGRRWHVSRTPAWREPSKRAASGWSDRHATVLLREHAQGEWVERGYRPDDVGQLIHHAVGLDREQFTQVVMLPQGQFARFLQAGSKEREELLEKLFGTDVYAEIQEELKARADDARTELRTAEAEVHRTDELLERFRERLVRARTQLPEAARCHVPGAGTASSGDGVPDDGPLPERHADATATAQSHPSAAEDPGETPRHAGEVSAPENPRAEALQRWSRLTSEGRDLVEEVGHARDRAAAAHTEAQRRVTRLEAMRDVVSRHQILTERRKELARDADRVETTERRLREHAAAQDLQEVLEAARRTAERVVDHEATVSRLRRALAADTDTGRAGREVLESRGDLLDALQEDTAVPDGLHEAAVAARETARSLVDREQALEEDRAEAQRERERIRDLEARTQRAGAELVAAREELAACEQVREELTASTRDEALVRERARTCQQAVTASREYERARILETERARDYERDETARRAAANRVEELETRRYAHAAATLAGELTAGEPCPVCGSTAHPQPATSGSGSEVTAAVLDGARAEREAAQSTVDRSHAVWREAQRAAAEALARGADPDLEAVVERARLAQRAEAELEERLERLSRNVAEIAGARERVVAVEGESHRLGTEAAGARSRAELLEQRCVRERRDVTEQLRGFATATAFLDGAENLVRTVTELEREQRALDAARLEDRAAQEALRRALDASPFQSPQDVADALLESSRAAEWTAWLESRHREQAAVDAELATHDMQRVGRLTPEERGECTQEAVTRAVADSAEREALRDRLTRELGGLQALVADITSCADQVPGHEEAYRRARDRSVRMSGLADVATATSPENSLRMTLTSFVLAAKLEQVAAVASEHLARMSSGRFTLVHTDETRGGGKSGLGLEIDDSWTGARRGTETLSGGESFFTSLALALALADVVRAEAGGRDIDTLFVDEGFGSLDEETLEQVLETLDGLRRDGRVIGVVSHVSEMKQRIDTQLRVVKTPQGSHLEVTAGRWTPA
ncbi:SMC family ATPase [Kocuria tytonis]|uniref:Nuclease SbcCD subunit C n=2 Tax=Kocuria tytonis TaxID=2054280 RepID=A0A495AE06_9MICC|nr:SMC family ATPase [Kocuria tytonis]